MKIHLNYQSALTLFGCIMAVVIITVSVVIIIGLKRLKNIKPRDLPEVENTVTNYYEYTWDGTQPWDVHIIPAPIDIVTAQPAPDPLLEKVLIAPTADISISVGSLTNWEHVATWSLWPSFAPGTFGAHETLHTPTFSIRMTEDYVFDIVPTKQLLTNKCVFWRTTKATP